MNARIPLLLAGSVAATLLLITVAAADPIEIPASPAGVGNEELIERCGTHSPTPAEVEQAHRRAARLRAISPWASDFRGGTIRVAIHVITNGAEGAVSDDAITDQMQEVNRNFAGTGYRFDLVSVDRTDNAAWFLPWYFNFHNERGVSFQRTKTWKQSSDPDFERKKGLFFASTAAGRRAAVASASMSSARSR